MSKAADLMGLGFSWPQALAEGYTSIAITAAGSAGSDATACDPQNSVFLMTATGADGVRMSTSVPLLRPIFVVNISGSTGLVYPFTGGNFSGGSTDAGISVPTRKTIIIMRYSSTGWLYNLSA